MREKIYKLLTSEIHEDILLGLNLITQEEFEELLSNVAASGAGVSYYLLCKGRVYYWCPRNKIFSRSLASSIDNQKSMAPERFITDVVL